MTDLIDNHLEEALGKMDSGFVRLVGHDKGIEIFQNVLFKQCGRPTDSKFWREENGVFLGLDGRKLPMMSLYYFTRTTERPEGGCYFHIQVIPDGNGGYRASAVTVGKLQ